MGMKWDIIDLDYARAKLIRMTDGEYAVEKRISTDELERVAHDENYYYSLLRTLQNQLQAHKVQAVAEREAERRSKMATTSYSGSSSDLADSLMYSYTHADSNVPGSWVDSTSTTATDVAYQAQLQQGIPSGLASATLSTFADSLGKTEKFMKFFRINKEVKIAEGAEVHEPLDELRLKVARWLNPKLRYA